MTASGMLMARKAPCTVMGIRVVVVDPPGEPGPRHRLKDAAVRVGEAEAGSFPADHLGLAGLGSRRADEAPWTKKRLGQVGPGSARTS